MALVSKTPVLKCCLCDSNEIPAPPGTNSRTRYFCKFCCGEIWIARHISSARGIPMATAMRIARDTIAKCSKLRWPVSSGAKSHSQSSAQVATLQ